MEPLPPSTPPNKQPAGWVTPKEAARHLAMTTADIYRLIDRGDLVAYRLRRTVRIRSSDVLDHRKSQ